MPCPHGGNSVSDRLSRRDFARTAVAIGGASALSACLERRDGGGETERRDSGGETDASAIPDLPKGDPESVPERQHSWANYVLSDEHGNPKFPEYQSFQFLDYAAEEGVDLVAIASHGKSPKEKLTSLGSVSERVVDGAMAPVLVVRADEESPANADEPTS